MILKIKLIQKLMRTKTTSEMIKIILETQLIQEMMIKTILNFIIIWCLSLKTGYKWNFQSLFVHVIFLLNLKLFNISFFLNIKVG